MKHLRKQIILVMIVVMVFNIFWISIIPEGREKKLSDTKTLTTDIADNSEKKIDLTSLKIVSLELSANRTVLSSGETTTLSLFGLLEDGSKVDLTMEDVEYTSGDPNVLTIEKKNNMMLATATNLGEGYVMADLKLGEEIKGATIKIKVDRITNSKTRSTYYTPVKVEAARNNVIKFDWAKKIKDTSVTEANKYLKLGYEALWNLVTPQSIPRSYAVNQPVVCPNCGSKIGEFGHYPYLSDPLSKPWKLECPNCHMKFPTNDFKAYYDSGKNSKGIFEPQLADRSLLVNKLYPEKGEKFGVDDGYGYIDELGNKYMFIAYYNHWGLWYKGVIDKALNSFRDAYIYTGDMRYARAGIILLDRIADVYPDMDISVYKAKDGFLNSDGGSNKGKVLGSIWETELTKDLLKAYDAFFPAMNDYETIQFLRNKAEKYKLKLQKTSVTEIRKNIEDGIVYQIYPAIKDAKIRGNTGMLQGTLALAAVVIDTLPETKEWLDFDFQAGYSSNTEVTGGNILFTMVNKVDRDGEGNEAAPQYNKLWISEYLEVADILKDYDLYPAADLYKNIKFRKMFYAMYPLVLSDIYSALIGDSGLTGSPISYMDKQQYSMAFERLDDPILGQIVYFLNNNKTNNLRGDIFDTDPSSVGTDIQKVINTYGTLRLDSTNLTGYGFAALRDGKAKISFEKAGNNVSEANNSLDTQRAIWMYYGKSSGHGHFDTLNIGLNAFKLDLMPDLGYPEFADESAHRTEWVKNTISHNTVVVDGKEQAVQTVGQPRHFDDGDIVKLIDVEAPSVYPKTTLYRRTTAMIKVDDKNSYVVDFFWVKGGSDHYFSFHGAEGNVTTEGLKLLPQLDPKKQPVGTYAASHIKFGIRTADDSVPGVGYTGSGFQWLNNVERDKSPGGSFSVDWKAKDTWNVYGKGYGADTTIHLRLTMLSKVTDVALADGIPPRNKVKNPKSLRYVIAHNHGQNLESLFKSVIEPYKDNRFIDSITSVPMKIQGRLVNDRNSGALKVTLKNGRVDYIINSLNADTTYTIDDKFQFKGFFGVYSEKDGKQIYGYLNDGTILGENIASSQGNLTGTIYDFTKDMNISNEITVKFDNENVKTDELIGKFIYAENDGASNAAYLIKGIKKVEGNLVTFDIGDITPIRRWIDSNDFSAGYDYDLTVDSKFTIPLVSIWQN
jgi:oligo-alginate lyase